MPDSVSSCKSDSSLLVLTDFSKASGVALRYAVVLAKYMRCHLALVHAYQVPEAGTKVIIDVADVIEEKAKKRLESLKKELAQKEEVKISSFCIKGSVKTAIAALQNKLQVEAIIMGAKGSTFTEESRFGSTTWQLFRHSSLPVLAIPSLQANPKVPEHVLVAADDRMQSWHSKLLFSKDVLKKRDGVHGMDKLAEAYFNGKNVEEVLGERLNENGLCGVCAAEKIDLLFFIFCHQSSSFGAFKREWAKTNGEYIAKPIMVYNYGFDRPKMTNIAG